MRKNELQFESQHEAKSLIESYDPERDEWIFPQVGDFWEAVKQAHKWGHSGEGKRIAIIDGSFDLRMPKLRAQATGSIHKWAKPGENKDHGTAVALLIATVAPSSSFDLYEVSEHQKPSLRLVMKALELAGQAEATLINLSLGKPVGNLELLDRSGGHCGLCNSASSAASHGKTVIAAVGNSEGERYCPAQDSSVLGIGFRREMRTVIETQEGGKSESAHWDKPSYPQSLKPAYTITQPANVLGSSFAAPLFTGALALIDNTDEVPQFLEALKIGGIAEAFHALLHDNTNFSADIKKKFIDLARQHYNKALSSLPHIHMEAQDGPPCISCSFFAQNLYTNAGLFFLNDGKLDAAEKLLSAVRWFAPWSPHAAANMAALLRAKALILLKDGDGGKKTEILRLLHSSRNEFQYALKLRPDNETYLSGLKFVDDTLSHLLNGESGETTKGY